MSKKNFADDLTGYKSECPKCKDIFQIDTNELFLDNKFSEKALQYYEQELANLQKYKEVVDKMIDQDFAWLSENTRAINAGFILEKLVLTFPDFPYEHSECRPMFDPIDYIVFNGLDSGEVNHITFVDIKTGNAKLTDGQKQIKQTVIDKNVKFRTYEY